MFHEESDVHQFVTQFKIDYLKVDNCNGMGNPLYWRYKRVSDQINL